MFSVGSVPDGYEIKTTVLGNRPLVCGDGLPLNINKNGRTKERSPIFYLDASMKKPEEINTYT